MSVLSAAATFIFVNILLIILLSTTAIIIIIIIVIKSKRSSNSKKPLINLPPGSYGWPVLGETLQFLRDGMEGKPDKFVRDRMEKHKSEVFKTSLLGEKMVVLCGPAGNKFLFGNENKSVSLWWPTSVRRLLGPCLSTSVGDEAKLIRKMLSPFVSPDAFNRLYVKTIDTVTRQHIQNHWQGKEKLKVFPVIKLYTFELACRLFMSLEDEDHITKLASLFNIFLKGVISIPLNLPGTRFHQAIRATNSIRKELLLIVQQRREALLQQETAFPPQDLLSHLLAYPDDNGKFMAESDIVNNILMLLFAGHDTSRVAITFLMRKLAELPEVYEKVLEEQREIASSKEAGEFLQWDDIQKMRYSWNVVSEVMRLLPPILGSFREALVDLKYEGYDIPKGWKFYWNAAVTHLDSSFFPNTTGFDPSRFEGAGPAPYSYVPFGGGPRMCLGKEYARLEILVFLHNVIKRFRWNLVIPHEKIAYDPIPTPVDGLPIHLHSHSP